MCVYVIYVCVLCMICTCKSVCVLYMCLYWARPEQNELTRTQLASRLLVWPSCGHPSPHNGGIQQTDVTHGHNLQDQHGDLDSREANQVLPRKGGLGPVGETQVGQLDRYSSGTGERGRGHLSLCLTRAA